MYKLHVITRLIVYLWNTFTRVRYGVITDPFISGVISVLQTHWPYAHYVGTALNRRSMQYWLAIGINLFPCESGQ